MEPTEFYDKFVSYQVKIGINERIFNLYQKVCKLGLTTGMHVLEIGCGIGSLTWLLSKKVRKGSIEAIDLSPVLIDFAQTQLVKANIHFSAGDILEYRPKNTFFDKILLFDVIEHIPLEQHPALFKKISTWMTEDSSILINIPNPNYLLYDHTHNPKSLQVIDQPIFIENLASVLSNLSLEIIHFETYSIWVKNDYNFIIVKKRTPFKETFLSEGRSLWQKVSLRLKREARKRFYKYPRKNR